MSMTVGQLREMLEDLDLNDDDEVRIVFQPSWPLQFEVAGIHISEDDEIVYLVQGSHPADSPYGPEAAWDSLERP